MTPAAPPVFSDDHWDDLLDFIEQGKVIPIIGEGAVTFGADDRPLYPWLAERLAERLEIPPERLGDSPTISRVVQEHLRRNGERNLIYSRLHRILKDPMLTPGSTLSHIAQIDAFKLVLSTSFAPLLERALNPDSEVERRC